MENNQPPPASSAIPTMPTSLPPPVVPTVSSPQSGSKKKLFIIIGIVFFVTIIFLGGFLYFSSDNLAPSVTPTPIPVNITPTESVIPSPVKASEIRLILKKNIETNIPGTNMKATYVGNTVPGRDCADCGSSYQMQVTQEGKSITLSLSCGGIAGICNEENVFNYIFRAGDHLTSDEIELVVGNGKN